MKHISEVLSKKVMDACFKHYTPEEFINHGLGWILEIDHDKLVGSGAISCHNGVDTILQDGSCLNVYNSTQDTWTNIMEGDLMSCVMEQRRIKDSKPNLKTAIKHFPKQWPAYWAHKKAQQDAATELEQGGQSLVKGGEYV